MQQKHVLIINQGNSDNLGDKAINLVLKAILEDNNCRVTSAGYSQCKEQNMELMSGRLTKNNLSLLRKIVPSSVLWGFKYVWSIKNEFKRISEIGQYDLVIIGGGQLLKTKNVFVYALLTWYKLINKHYKCPIVILGVGTDDKFTIFEKMIYKKVLSGVDDIYVRDNNSITIINREFGVSCKYIPDVAFAYSQYYNLNCTDDKNIILLMIYDYQELKHNFGTNHNFEEYYETWNELLINNNFKGSRVVLGYTTIGDKKETLKFAQFLNENSNINFTIADTDDIDKFTNILVKTKKIISARMHAMILGMTFNCEVVPYTISSKINTFKEEWIDSGVDISQTRKEVVAKITALLEKYQNGM